MLRPLCGSTGWRHVYVVVVALTVRFLLKPPMCRLLSDRGYARHEHLNSPACSGQWIPSVMQLRCVHDCLASNSVLRRMATACGMPHCVLAEWRDASPGLSSPDASIGGRLLTCGTYVLFLFSGGVLHPCVCAPRALTMSGR